MLLYAKAIYISILLFTRFANHYRHTLLIVRSLSGKNWQDLYKADKVSISFPATPKSNWNVFGGVIKIFEKFIIPGGETLLVWNNGSECLFMFYSIIVFNNKVVGYFSKTQTWQQINGHITFPVWCSHSKYHWLAEKNCQLLTCYLIEVTPPWLDNFEHPL